MATERRAQADRSHAEKIEASTPVMCELSGAGAVTPLSLSAPVWCPTRCTGSQHRVFRYNAWTYFETPSQKAKRGANAFCGENTMTGI